MTRKASVFGALVVAVVVVALVAVVLSIRAGSSETGTDAHAHMDPVANPQTAAADIMAGLHSWSPADQASPWDAMHLMADRLTGRLATAAATRPNPDPAPRQWASWARNRDRVVGSAAVTDDQPPQPEDSGTAEVTVTVKQVVMHADGATTPRESMVVRVEMVQLDHDWKAEYFQVVRMVERTN